MLPFHVVVEADYRIRANLSSLSVTVVSNSSSGTVRIPFAVTVDRDNIGSGFLETPQSSGLIGLILVDSPGFTFSSSNSTVAVHRSLTGVEVVNDTVRGVAYVVRDEVVYPYSLSSPVTAPLEVPFIMNALVQGPEGREESRTPFFDDSVEIIPPGEDKK